MMNDIRGDTMLAWLLRQPLASARPLVRYGAALLLTLAGLVVRFWLDPLLPPGFPFVTFFPAVIAAAFLFGPGPGAFAGVLGFFLSSWYFIPPAHSMTFDHGRAMAMALYTFVVVVDIVLVHLMQRAYRQVDAAREMARQLADHREILFRELQHRVGNNLQMVSSLLALQKRKQVEPEARAAVDEAARRLGLIGRIQRQLYDPSGAQLGLRGFIDQICQDILGSGGRDGISITVEGGEGVKLSSESAIPLALTIAEAVSNSIEHGFAGRDAGKIVVEIADSASDLRITVADDGVGLPDGFDIARSSSLGLRLAQSLVAGKGGRFSLEPGAGGAIATIVMVHENEVVH